VSLSSAPFHPSHAANRSAFCRCRWLLIVWTVPASGSREPSARVSGSHPPKAARPMPWPSRCSPPSSARRCAGYRSSGGSAHTRPVPTSSSGSPGATTAQKAHGLNNQCRSPMKINQLLGPHWLHQTGCAHSPGKPTAPSPKRPLVLGPSGLVLMVVNGADLARVG
jgi:hypothetical protein